jgi:hypothetical protein
MRGSIKLPRGPHRPGVCPECGHTTLNYSNNETDFSDLTVRCTWSCEACGAEGTEHYSLDFLNHSLATPGDRTKMLDR